MKNKLFIALFCAISLSGMAQQPTYQQLVDRAFAATEQDSLLQAEDYIRQALKLEPANPHNAMLFSNLGTIQRRMHRYESALQSYTFALNFAPKAVPILMNRATLHLELGKNDAARVDYSLVLDLDKDNEEALLMRAYIYMQQRDYKSARADYVHLLKVDPVDYKARLGLATLAQKEGKMEEALTLLNQLINEDPMSKDKLDASALAVLYVARAGVEKDLKHADLALVDLEEAIRLDATQSNAYLIRGQIYLSAGKKGLAKQDFETAIRLGVPRGDLNQLLQQCR